MPDFDTRSTLDDAPALRFVEVTKSYGRTRALAGISLEVRQGEFFGLIGINGAGKTTLIKSLLDFCASTAGASKSSAHRTAARRRARGSPSSPSASILLSI